MTAFLTNKVQSYISKQTDSWFAHVSYLRPPLFVAPEPYNKMYSTSQVPTPVWAEIAEALAHPKTREALKEGGYWNDHWIYPSIGGDMCDHDIAEVRAT